jgi:hypothetical protein
VKRKCSRKALPPCDTLLPLAEDTAQLSPELRAALDAILSAQRKILQLEDRPAWHAGRLKSVAGLLANVVSAVGDAPAGTALKAALARALASSVLGLRRAMGHIQFQDVMRQRMEHVQGALVEMREHLRGLSEKPLDTSWDGQLEYTFKTLLAAHLDTYSMASQTETHNAADGMVQASRDECPKFEMF